jgi:hypothetical protein
MSRTVLIVEGNEGRRHAVRSAFAGRGISTMEVNDAFTGLAALGRSDFGAIVLAEARRALSLKGLVQLARKRHEGIRIFVILAAAANADRVRAQLGDDVITIAPDASVEGLATQVASELDVGDVAASNPWQGESVLAGSSKTSGGLSSESGPVLGAPTALSLEGTLDDGDGAALLMALLAQELTGTLRIDEGEQQVVIYFSAGEPVWADEKGGDRAVHRRLLAKKIIDEKQAIAPVPDGDLLESLFKADAIRVADVVELMRDAARDAVLDLAQRRNGTYRFVEQRAFRDWPPIVRLNPFGLVFESRRRTHPPERLVALAAEMSARYIVPGPALRAAAPKLRPFLRDRDAGELIDGRSTVADLTRETGLDAIMGALLVTTLVDGRLARLADKPISDEERTALAAAAVAPVDVRTSGSGLDADASDDDKRNAIRSIAMRIRALVQPTQVLGIPLHASRDETEAAYRQRISELDPARVPEGADAEELLRLLAEIRAKVKGAYETLVLTTSTSVSTSESNPGFDMDSNPF